jgi:hypothetical protein
MIEVIALGEGMLLYCCFTAALLQREAAWLDREVIA